jgi:2-polyprenyl-6-methoxyphenol hydroxylase-like FAD-dependent oxidoreductase
LARVVIGADGRHSTVLKAVGAVDYGERPVYTAGYYTYWSGLPIDEFRVYVRPHRAIVVVPTHDNLRLVLVGWPRAEFTEHKGDVEGTYLRAIAQVPELAELIGGATREARFLGTGDMPNAFRKPFGPGWALVGDAGYVKDPCTAQGISDSFRDAELLATALDLAFSGRATYEQALGEYQRTRDQTVKPLFDFTCMLAPMDPLPAFVRFLFASMEGNQGAMDRFMGIFAGTVPVRRFFNPLNVLGILGSRALRLGSRALGLGGRVRPRSDTLATSSR